MEDPDWNSDAIQTSDVRLTPLAIVVSSATFDAAGIRCLVRRRNRDIGFVYSRPQDGPHRLGDRADPRSGAQREAAPGLAPAARAGARRAARPVAQLDAR